MKKVTIIGSGLAGCLLALYLARRDYEIWMYESRPDLRRDSIDRGRSINLALSCRGMTGLIGVGIEAEVSKIMVPMRARAIHHEDGEINYQPFGRHKDEHINAILRVDLNKLLLDQLEKYPKVHLHFNTRLIACDFDQQTLQFEQPDGMMVNKNYEQLVAADGASSVVRELLLHKQHIQSSREYLAHGYKELSIYQGKDKQFEREHLHLWPRDSHLLLGNPNRDGSITGSLFLANTGKDSFEELDNEIRIHNFFKKSFKDAVPAMPYLVEEFLNNPTGKMSTICTFPWNYKHSCLLIGDAAHGVVPFFGQGMNSAFEDCRVLNELLVTHQDDWHTIAPLFYQVRKPNTDAVAQMSLDNYHEIQTDIRQTAFNFKKQLEWALMKQYPDRYVSKHVLVMFTNTPYAQAYAIGELQLTLLDTIARKYKTLETVHWEEVAIFMQAYDKKLAQLLGA